MCIRDSGHVSIEGHGGLRGHAYGSAYGGCSSNSAEDRGRRPDVTKKQVVSSQVDVESLAELLRGVCWPALAQVLLRDFRTVFPARRRTTVPRSWLSRLGSTSPSRCQNTAADLSAAPLLDDAIFTTKIAVHGGVNALAPFRYVAFLDTGSHRPSSGAIYWTACS